MPQPVDRNDFPRTSRSFLAHQNRRVSRSSAGAAVAGDAAVRFAACWFTDKAAMGATL